MLSRNQLLALGRAAPRLQHFQKPTLARTQLARTLRQRPAVSRSFSETSKNRSAINERLPAQEASRRLREFQVRPSRVANIHVL